MAESSNSPGNALEVLPLLRWLVAVACVLNSIQHRGVVPGRSGQYMAVEWWLRNRNSGGGRLQRQAHAHCLTAQPLPAAIKPFTARWQPLNISNQQALATANSKQHISNCCTALTWRLSAQAGSPKHQELLVVVQQQSHVVLHCLDLQSRHNGLWGVRQASEAAGSHLHKISTDVPVDVACAKRRPVRVLCCASFAQFIGCMHTFTSAVLL